MSKRLDFRRMKVLAGAALAVGLLCAPALAQKQEKQPPKQATPPPAAQEASAWAVTCSDRSQNKFQCEMTQVLLDQQTRRQVLLISIKNSATGDAKIMLVRVVHGVYLPSGLSIKVEKGQPIVIAFQKSDQAGVYAALPLTDKLIADMRKGKDLTFSMEVEQGKPLELVARLFGFGPAFDRLNSVR